MQVFDLHPFALLRGFRYDCHERIAAFHTDLDRLDPFIAALDGGQVLPDDMPGLLKLPPNLEGCFHIGACITEEDVPALTAFQNLSYFKVGGAPLLLHAFQRLAYSAGQHLVDNNIDVVTNSHRGRSADVSHRDLIANSSQRAQG